MAEGQRFDGWAILEIMGHRVRAGLVLMDDSATIQIDIPIEGGGEVTEFYGRAAIFSLRPCTEEIARQTAKMYGDPRPVRPVDYRERAEVPQLPFATQDEPDDSDFDIADDPFEEVAEL
jgi:hypothetical protein